MSVRLISSMMVVGTVVLGTATKAQAGPAGTGLIAAGPVEHAIREGVPGVEKVFWRRDWRHHRHHRHNYWRRGW